MHAHGVLSDATEKPSDTDEKYPSESNPPLKPVTIYVLFTQIWPGIFTVSYCIGLPSFALGRVFPIYICPTLSLSSHLMIMRTACLYTVHEINYYYWCLGKIKHLKKMIKVRHFGLVTTCSWVGWRMGCYLKLLMEVRYPGQGNSRHLIVWQSVNVKVTFKAHAMKII